MNRYLVFNIGCIECGVTSNVVGMYATKEQADRVVKILSEKLEWREDGQNSFEVFDLFKPQAAEYRDILSGVAQ